MFVVAVVVVEFVVAVVIVIIFGVRSVSMPLLRCIPFEPQSFNLLLLRSRIFKFENPLKVPERIAVNAQLLKLSVLTANRSLINVANVLSRSPHSLSSKMY